VGAVAGECLAEGIAVAAFIVRRGDCSAAATLIIFPELLNINLAEALALTKSFIRVGDRHDGLSSVGTESVVSVMHDRLLIIGSSKS